MIGFNNAYGRVGYVIPCWTDDSGDYGADLPTKIFGDPITSVGREKFLLFGMAPTDAEVQSAQYNCTHQVAQSSIM